jgi:hypothetical protein
MMGKMFSVLIEIVPFSLIMGLGFVFPFTMQELFHPAGG